MGALRRSPERGKRVGLLVLGAEGFAACGQDVDLVRRVDDPFDHHRRRPDEVLAVVDDEQQPAVAQEGQQAGEHVRVLRREAQGRRDRGDQQGRLRHGRQVHEDDGIVEGDLQFVTDGDRHGGLADAAGADDRHQPLLADLLGDAAHRLLASHHVFRPRRQVAGERKVGRQRRLGKRRPRGRRHEAVAPARHIRDVADTVLPVLERPAKPRDMSPEAALLHDQVRPHAGEEFLLADHLAGLRREGDQQVEGAAADRHGHTVAFEAPFAGEQPERSERDDIRLRIFYRRP